MYRVRTAGYRKRDQAMRWALPDRVFFACGACHVLAAAFLERFGTDVAKPLAIIPAPGFTHGHLVVASEAWVFDYHGYAEREGYFAHTFAKARRWWPGWDAALVPVPPGALTSEAASREIPGLWLRAPQDFLHDAMPRARAYLDRFAHPPATVLRGMQKILNACDVPDTCAPYQGRAERASRSPAVAPWRDIHDPMVREGHG